MPHFMIVVIPCNNLLNLSWTIKCLFLRDMEPLKSNAYCFFFFCFFFFFFLFFFFCFFFFLKLFHTVSDGLPVCNSLLFTLPKLNSMKEES